MNRDTLGKIQAIQLTLQLGVNSNGFPLTVEERKKLVAAMDKLNLELRVSVK